MYLHFVREDQTRSICKIHLLDRMVLSQPDSTPEMTSKSEWNCTVDYWEDFLPHLACNLRRECAAGEDEHHCHYQPCQTGGFTAHGGCYLLVRTEAPIPFDAARQECQQRDGYLVSFNTVVEMEAVTEAVWARSRKFDFIVGLTSAPASLQSM